MIISIGGVAMVCNGDRKKRTGLYIIIPPLSLLVALLQVFCGRQEPVSEKVTTKEMVLIPAAGKRFRMGYVAADTARNPGVEVSFSHDFLIDRTEVTQADYRALMGSNPSAFTGDMRRPVEMVTWFDAVLYCNARSRRDGFDTVYVYTGMSADASGGCRGLENLTIDYTKQGYRLPTEAEWEYACRGDATTAYYWGESTAEDTAGHYAWYSANSGRETHPVARKLPNAFGLYDMSGNVWEWCNDWYGDYTRGSVTDPAGPPRGSERVRRGGSWHRDLSYARAVYRYGRAPDRRRRLAGFRCVFPVR